MLKPDDVSYTYRIRPSRSIGSSFEETLENAKLVPVEPFNGCKDLVENKELDLHIRPDGSSKYNDEPDFKFVVLEKFISFENEFSFKEGFLLNSYFSLKGLGVSDEKAFGLDKSDVVVEEIPLIFHPVTDLVLKRKLHIKNGE